MAKYMGVTNQEWNVVEGDTPWEHKKLPNGEIFNLQPYEKKKITDSIKCLGKYDGEWASENYKLDIVFIPKKNSFFMNSGIPISVGGLVNNSINRNFMLFPKRKKSSVKYEKKEIVDFYKRMGFERFIHVRKDEVFKKLGYVPTREFIAQNYQDEFKKERKEIKHVKELMIKEQPTLIYSPYMNDKEQLDHLCNIIPKLKKLKVDNQEKYKEIEKVIEMIQVLLLNNEKDSLDKISDYANGILDVDLSTLIYNYRYINNVNANSKNGLYLYKRYNMIPLMTYSIHYDKIKFLSIKEKNEFLDLREWKFQNKYLINEYKKSYFKIDDNSLFINLNGIQTQNIPQKIIKTSKKRTNYYEIYYLVQRQFFKNDIIPVNLPPRIDIKGSLRINSLCTFKIYF